MLELNITFQEKYKKLDNLCKDCYGSKEGISEYINQMEKNHQSGLRLIPNWDDDYKQLKHSRWIRNQLAHETGTLYLDVCSKNDIEFITIFYNNILNTKDPLAVLQKIIKEKNRPALIKTQPNNKISYSTLSSAIEKSSHKQTEYSSNSIDSNKPTKQKSLLKKLFEKIFNRF